MQSPSSPRTPRLHRFISVFFVWLVGLQFGGLLQEKTRCCLALSLLKLCRLAMTRWLRVKALRQMASHLKWDQNYSLFSALPFKRSSTPNAFLITDRAQQNKGYSMPGASSMAQDYSRKLPFTHLDWFLDAANAAWELRSWSTWQVPRIWSCEAFHGQFRSHLFLFVGIMNDSRHLRLSRPCPTGARFLASLWIVCGHFAPRLEESAFTVVRHRGGQIYKWQVTFWRQNPDRPPFPV